MTLETGDRWFMYLEWGFNVKPSDLDLDAYYKCLLICANGDGTLTPEEREWVIGYCAAIGGSDELVEELRKYPATDDVHVVMAGNAPVTEYGARPLVFDAIRASAADGELNENELKVVRRMASKLNVSEHAVHQLQQLYAEERALREKRLNLVFPHGNPFGEQSN